MSYAYNRGRGLLGRLSASRAPALEGVQAGLLVNHLFPVTAVAAVPLLFGVKFTRLGEPVVQLLFFSVDQSFPSLRFTRMTAAIRNGVTAGICTGSLLVHQPHLTNQLDPPTTLSVL